ncbi:MAG: aminopeptidase [Betaproteobacteria bacterium]
MTLRTYPHRRCCASALALCLLGGCADTGYLLQSLQGHLQLLQAARPVTQWLSDEHTPQELRQRLQLAQRMRSFAVSDLGLPDNASYRSYADLQRSAVVWNVVAAPAFSLTLTTWCFPITGCIGYKGFFDQDQARAESVRLQTQELETSVYGVPAYSTLGWMNWAGGDPLLNTFIRYPEGELARMVFHELAHQLLYVQDDTVFNESFATAVERLGAQRWLTAQASPAARQEYAELDARHQQFRALVRSTRQALEAVYVGPAVATAALAQRSERKLSAMREFRQAYAQLRLSWGGYAGYDAWVAGANNASFGAISAYDELVPGFEALFLAQGQDWSRFYDAVRHLARLSPDERREALKTGTLPETHRG